MSNLREEHFSDDDTDDDEVRPELDILPRERKLLTQPFDFIVGSLQEQIKSDQLILQDDYQRRQVWDERKSSRLIESLLLNVPIPVCYFAELEDGRFSVIDGQQRLTSIARYIENLFPLKGLRVRPELNKLRFSELTPADQRTIRTRTIRCIVIQRESHPDIRFDVFERLNQGAVRLTAQELRNSTYRGKLNSLVKELCADKTFQKVRRVTDLDARMKDAELVLRFFAFHYNAANYKGFFAPFLDKYLEAGMKLTDEQIEEHRQTFNSTIAKADAVFGSDAFRQIDAQGKVANQVNRAIFDVVMWTFVHIDPAKLVERRLEIRDALQRLCNTNEVFQDAIGRATRDKARVNNRVRLWGELLNAIGVACPHLHFGEPDDVVAGA